MDTREIYTFDVYTEKGKPGRPLIFHFVAGPASLECLASGNGPLHLEEDTIDRNGITYTTQISGKQFILRLSPPFFRESRLDCKDLPDGTDAVSTKESKSSFSPAGKYISDEGRAAA